MSTGFLWRRWATSSAAEPPAAATRSRRVVMRSVVDRGMAALAGVPGGAGGGYRSPARRVGGRSAEVGQNRNTLVLHGRQSRDLPQASSLAVRAGTGSASSAPGTATAVIEMPARLASGEFSQLPVSDGVVPSNRALTLTRRSIKTASRAVDTDFTQGDVEVAGSPIAFFGRVRSGRHVQIVHRMRGEGVAALGGTGVLLLRRRSRLRSAGPLTPFVESVASSPGWRLLSASRLCGRPALRGGRRSTGRDVRRVIFFARLSDGASGSVLALGRRRNRGDARCRSPPMIDERGLPERSGCPWRSR